MNTLKINIFVSHNIRRALRIVNIFKKFNNITTSVFVSNELDLHYCEELFESKITAFSRKDLHGLTLNAILWTNEDWVWNIEDSIALSSKIICDIIKKIELSESDISILKINSNDNFILSRADLPKKVNRELNARDFVCISNTIIRIKSIDNLENPFKSVSTRLSLFIIFLDQLSKSNRAQFCSLKIKTIIDKSINLTAESELLKSKYFIPSKFSHEEYLAAEKMIDRALIPLKDISLHLNSLRINGISYKEAIIMKSLLFSYIITSKISFFKKIMIAFYYLKFKALA
jgi:hypothetical protein